MRFCIFGAGAVGGHLAAKLSAAGHDVSVVARGAHLAAMREKGVRLLHGDKVITGRVRAAERSSELGPQDYVLVTLKANMLGAFADAAPPLLGPSTGVVFVQNGIPWWYGASLPRLDPGGKLARAISADAVLGGVVYSANEVIEPGVVENHVPGSNMLVVGRPDDRQTPQLEALREALDRADIASPPARQIRASVWAKLVQNLGTAPVCTLAGVPVGEARSNPRLAPIAARLVAEGYAIVKGLGIDLAAAPQRPGGAPSSGQAGSLSAHKPSMLQDYERGRPMEVESMLMAPLALARAAKVEAPVLEAIANLVAHRAAARGLYEKQ